MVFQVHGRHAIRTDGSGREVNHQRTQCVDLAAVFSVHVGAGGIEHNLHAICHQVRNQAVHAVGRGFDAHVAGSFEAVGFRVDAHHPHGFQNGAALQFGQQVGADVAGPDQGAFDFLAHDEWCFLALSSECRGLKKSVETHRAAAQPADGHAEVVARLGRGHGRQRAGQNDFARLHANAQPPQRVGQPGHRVDG